MFKFNALMILVFLYGQGILFGDNNQKNQCENDNDCELVVPKGCCSCEQGGKRVATLKGIEKNTEQSSCEDFGSMPEQQCSLKESAHPSCLPDAKASCFSGTCFFMLPYSAPVSLPPEITERAEKKKASERSEFSVEEIRAMLSLKRISKGTAITFTPFQDIKFELAWYTMPDSMLGARFRRQGCSWKTIQNEPLVINYIPNRDIKGRGESLVVYLKSYLGSSPQGFSCRVEKGVATSTWYIKCEATGNDLKFTDSYFQGAECPYSLVE